MRSHSTAKALAFCVASSFAACGGTESKQPPAALEGPVPEDRFLSELQSALCDGIGHCCRDAGMPHNPNACRRYVEEQILYNFPPEHRNRFEYDPVKAGECIALARRTGETCLTTSRSDGLCWEAYQGKTQPGEVCLAYLECAVPPGGSARCGAGNTIEPTCQSQPRGVAGDHCNGDCNEGLDVLSCGGQIIYHDPVVALCYKKDGLYCDDGFCRPLIPLGSACSRSGECELGAHCGCEGGTSCQTRGCAPKLALGAACASDDNCLDSLYCERQSSTCQERKPNGAPCEFNGDSRRECQGECGFDGTQEMGKCVDELRFPLTMCNPRPF